MIGLILLSTNYQGYKTLIKISTFLNTKKSFLTNEEIKKELLNNSNLIVIIKVKNITNIILKQIWSLLNEKIDNEVYLGISESNIKDLSILNKLTKKMIAINLVIYLKSEDAIIVQILEAIKTNKILKKENLIKQGSNYYKNEIELKKIFPD